MSTIANSIRDASQGRTVPIAIAGIILSAAVLWALFTVNYDAVSYTHLTLPTKRIV